MLLVSKFMADYKMQPNAVFEIRFIFVQWKRKGSFFYFVSFYLPVVTTINFLIASFDAIIVYGRRFNGVSQIDAACQEV